jgi:hypothetical protein
MRVVPEVNGNVNGEKRGDGGWVAGSEGCF